MSHALATFRTRASTWVLLVLMVSCGTSEHVVRNGILQKGKYHRGWHVDLGRKPDKPPSATKAAHPVHAAETSDDAPEHPSINGTVLYASLMEPPAPMASSTPGSIGLQRPMATEGPPSVIRVEARTQDPLPEQPPNGPFNPVGVLALVLVIGGVALAFVTNSGWLVAGVLMLGILMASIGLRRIRSREQRGKGYALIALILGLIAALITTMVIIRTGF